MVPSDTIWYCRSCTSSEGPAPASGASRAGRRLANEVGGGIAMAKLCEKYFYIPIQSNSWDKMIDTHKHTQV